MLHASVPTAPSGVILQHLFPPTFCSNRNIGLRRSALFFKNKLDLSVKTSYLENINLLRINKNINEIQEILTSLETRGKDVTVKDNRLQYTR